MDCPDYFRLRENYENAVRRWSQLMLAPAEENRFSEAKRRAYEERDEARRQRDMHRLQCSICNSFRKHAAS